MLKARPRPTSTWSSTALTPRRWPTSGPPPSATARSASRSPTSSCFHKTARNPLCCCNGCRKQRRARTGCTSTCAPKTSRLRSSASRNSEPDGCTPAITARPGGSPWPTRKATSSVSVRASPWSSASA